MHTVNKLIYCVYVFSCDNLISVELELYEMLLGYHQPSIHVEHHMQDLYQSR